MLFRSSATSTTIFSFNWTVHLFILTIFFMIEREFPRSMDRKWTANCVALDFFLWGCVKGQVYSQRVNMTLDEPKARITAAIADVTKDVLQCVWQEVDSRWAWDVCRAKDDAHCVVVCVEQLRGLCAKSLFQFLNKRLQI
jgi:hypothetical protein